MLTIIRSITIWHSTRDDGYVSPDREGHEAVPRTAPASASSPTTNCALIWKAAEQGGQFGSLVQLALLTGQRLDKLLDHALVGHLVRGRVDRAAVVDREKGTGGKLALPELAQAVLRRQPRILGTDLRVSASAGTRPDERVGRARTTFEATLPPMERWTIHDLRRTCTIAHCRALACRPSTPSGCLGHTIKGVEGIYNRHDFHDEKRIALEKLAALIVDIIEPPTDKVVPIRARP